MFVLNTGTVTANVEEFSAIMMYFFVSLKKNKDCTTWKIQRRISGQKVDTSISPI